MQVNALRKVLGGDRHRAPCPGAATASPRGSKATAPINAPAGGARAPASRPLQTQPAASTAAGAARSRRRTRHARRAASRPRACVSVVGAGGIGKSLLAQHLLRCAPRRLPARRLLGRAGGVADARRCPARWPHALGIRLGARRRDAALVRCGGTADAAARAGQRRASAGRGRPRWRHVCFDAAAGPEDARHQPGPAAGSPPNTCCGSTLALPPRGRRPRRRCGRRGGALRRAGAARSTGSFALDGANAAR